MNPVDNKKYARAIDPGVIKDTAAWTGQVVDTQGCDYIRFVAYIGSIDATATAFKIQEADAIADGTTLSGGTDVIDPDTKPGADNDNEFWIKTIKLDGSRKRYMQLQANAGNGAAGTYLTAWAELYPAQLPDSDADRNATTIS